jgi:type IV pilus assembly protein PilW
MTGFTLVELMVAILVGVAVLLSVVAVQKAFEGQRRTSTSSNDIDNAGAYVMSQLDGMLRSAGSGFTQAYSQTYGCQLNAALSGTTLVPPPLGAFPDPFTNVIGNAGLGASVRMAPVLIMPGATPVADLDGGVGSSDVLMIMSGAGYAANLQTAFTAKPTANGLTTESTAAFNPSDLVLLMDAATPTGPAPCALEQVAAGFAGGAGVTAVPLGGNYYSTAPLSPASMTINGAAVAIGNTAKGNFPTFDLIGVGPNRQLYAYDLLNFQGTQLLPIGDSVMELHALYLIPSGNANGYIGVDPAKAVTPGYQPLNLMAGTTAAATNLNNIKAVRIGLILKSPLLERPTGTDVNGNVVHVAPAALTLFSSINDANNAAMTYTRNLSQNNCAIGKVAPVPAVGCELDYRYRTIELTIPLRNPLLY